MVEDGSRTQQRHSLQATLQLHVPVKTSMNEAPLHLEDIYTPQEEKTKPVSAELEGGRN